MRCKRCSTGGFERKERKRALLFCVDRVGEGFGDQLRTGDRAAGDNGVCAKLDAAPCLCRRIHMAFRDDRNGNRGQNRFEPGKIIVSYVVSLGLRGVAHQRGGNTVKSHLRGANGFVQRGDIGHQQLAGSRGSGGLKECFQRFALRTRPVPARESLAA